MAFALVAALSGREAVCETLKLVKVFKLHTPLPSTLNTNIYTHLHVHLNTSIPVKNTVYNETATMYADCKISPFAKWLKLNTVIYEHIYGFV